LIDESVGACAEQCSTMKRRRSRNTVAVGDILMV
jgi:hypothetical protein